MMIINKPITGQETKPDNISPYSTLVDFYHAFNSQNSELIQSNWLQTEEASMSNPLGGVKRGWNEIRDVYRKIFNGDADVNVEFYDYSIHESKNMFIAVGRERGTLKFNNKNIELEIRTSRTYYLQNNLWKQLHHHGSMDDPQLLNTYQTTLIHKS